MSISLEGLIASVNRAAPEEICDEIINKIDDGFMQAVCGTVQISGGHAPAPGPKKQF